MNLNTGELIAAALAAGVITKGGGGWLSFGEQKLGQGADNAVATLTEKPELAEQIKAAVDTKAGSTGSESAVNDKPKPPPKARKDELREFIVESAVLHDKEHYAAGDSVSLTQAQFDALKLGGAIDKSLTWDDGK